MILTILQFLKKTRIYYNNGIIVYNPNLKKDKDLAVICKKIGGMQLIKHPLKDNIKPLSCKHVETANNWTYFKLKPNGFNLPSHHAIFNPALSPSQNLQQMVKGETKLIIFMETHNPVFIKDGIEIKSLSTAGSTQFLEIHTCQMSNKKDILLINGREYFMDFRVSAGFLDRFPIYKDFISCNLYSFTLGGFNTFYNISGSYDIDIGPDIDIV